MFITFEGIEGCGKTTQIKRLAKTLEKHGIQFARTLEPGGTQVGMTIRKVLLDSRNKNLTPLTELILYAADRAQHVEEVIIPALNNGRWVICDRFFDATVAYQGSARGQDMELIKILNDSATQGIRPDITFLLDCPAETGLDRAVKRNEISSQDDQDRFEREKMDFHRAVRRGYLDLAQNEKKRFIIIDAALTEDDVEQQIYKALRPFLEADVRGH
ncbi:dTMP kinase [Deltaproteobacteria bacterium]|nr:dTMP kinase [Deltaproteobacteria bacterium]